MSKIEVLCATMHQTDFSLIKKMNISTDVVFANQADKYEYSSVDFDGNHAKMITTNTIGVGVNRNIALIHASDDTDIALIADDDMIYNDNYVKIISEAFQKLPDADAIIFNIKTIGAQTNRRTLRKISRIHSYNCLNYGAARLAVKLKRIKQENMFFHRSFGGGTEFSSGEDSLFIWDMIKRKFKIYAYPATIATVDQSSSTWFKGYTKKYIFDKGALFYCLSKHYYFLLNFQCLVRHKCMYKDSGLTFIQAFKLMINGVEYFKAGLTYKDYTNNS
ncbi:MAG: glycosyltransferase family 2 protein [Clostridia bacterium]|nr:glycosyltransferase family 2 protein [Clostridia bacterium]